MEEDTCEKETEGLGQGRAEGATSPVADEVEVLGLGTCEASETDDLASRSNEKDGSAESRTKGLE